MSQSEELPKSNHIILIVDDEEIVLTSLKSLLELETDYTIVTFLTPEDALHMLRQGPVDLIISDFLMPEMGYEGGGAQFPTAWFTYGFALPKELNYAILRKPKKKDLPGYWRSVLNE